MKEYYQLSVLRNRLDTIINEDIRNEIIAACTQYPPMNTPHEGYAIILEELDELWQEVRKKQSQHDLNAMRKEAKQIAAMAIRFMLDLT